MRRAEDIVAVATLEALPHQRPNHDQQEELQGHSQSQGNIVKRPVLGRWRSHICSGRCKGGIKNSATKEDDIEESTISSVRDTLRR